MARGFNTSAGGTSRVVWSGPRSAPYSPFTIAAKCYSTGVSAADYDGSCFFCLNRGLAWQALAYDNSDYTDGRIQYQNGDGGAWQSVTDDTAMLDNRWYSVIGTTASDTSHRIDVYDMVADRHGSDTGTIAVSYINDDYNFVQGNNDASSSYNRGWDGYWAECAYWTVALTTAERAAYQAGVSPLLIRPASLLFYDPSISGLRQEQIGGRTGTETGTISDFAHPPGILYPSGIWTPAWYGVSGGGTLYQRAIIEGVQAGG